MICIQNQQRHLSMSNQSNTDKYRCLISFLLLVSLSYVQSACDTNYVLTLDNQAPEASMTDNGYCTQDHLILFHLSLVDYEKSFLDVELSIDGKILDLSNAYSSGVGAQSDMIGYSHYFAWQKECTMQSNPYSNDETAPAWTQECPPGCGLRPSPMLNTDMQQCLSAPAMVPDRLDLRVTLSDGDAQSETTFALEYQGECDLL